ncbi:MAG: MFS transporter [Actinobacteria bacterium]|nr:MFS transporter [Actinomycetota bacterium]
MKTKKTRILLLFIFFFFGIATSSIDPLVPIIAIELKKGLDKIGLVLFIGFFSLIITNFISGRLGDKINTKKIMISGMLLIITGFLVFGIYINFIVFILVIIIIRMGFGTLDSSSYTYVSQVFPENRSEIFIKLNLLWYMGSVAGPLLISAALLIKVNPRFAFLLNVIFFMIMFLLFNKIGLDKNIRYAESLVKKPAENIRTIIKNPIIILSCLILFFYAGSIFGLTAWLTTYFSAFKVDIAMGSSLLSLYWISSIIGLLLIGKFLKKIDETKLMFFSYLIGVAFTIAVCIVPAVYIKIIFLMLQGLFLSAVFPLSKSIPVGQYPLSAGTIIAIILPVQTAGIMVFQLILGYVAEKIGRFFILYVILASLIIGLTFTFALLIKTNKLKVVAK